MNKFRVFEAFAGIGAQHKALSNLKEVNEIEDYEMVAISEWDMWANIAYYQIHNQQIELDENSTLDEIKEVFLNKFPEMTFNR